MYKIIALNKRSSKSGTLYKLFNEIISEISKLPAANKTITISSFSEDPLSNMAKWISRFNNDLKNAGFDIKESIGSNCNPSTTKVIMIASKRYMEAINKKGEDHPLKREIEVITSIFKKNPKHFFPVLVNSTSHEALPKFITKGKLKTSFTDFRGFITCDTIENMTNNYYTLFLMILRSLLPSEHHSFISAHIRLLQSPKAVSTPVKAMVLDIVSRCGRAFTHLPPEYRSDIDVISLTRTRCPRVLKYITSVSLTTHDQDIDRYFIDAIKRIAQKHPPHQSLFISYAWGNLQEERWVQRFKTHLEWAGFHIYFDQDLNMATGSLDSFTSHISNKETQVILVGSNKFSKKLNKSGRHHVVKDEIKKIKEKYQADPQSIIPILLNGEESKSFPKFLKNKDPIDFRDFKKQNVVEQTEENYFTTFFGVLRKLHPESAQESLKSEAEKLKSIKLRNNSGYAKQMDINEKRKREIVLALVEKSGRLLCHMDDTYKDDDVVVQAAVNQYPNAKKYASERLQKR